MSFDEEPDGDPHGECAVEIRRLRAVIAKGRAGVEDFMPNVGRCVLQDYGRLNEFLLESIPDAAVKRVRAVRNSSGSLP